MTEASHSSGRKKHITWKVCLLDRTQNMRHNPLPCEYFGCCLRGFLVYQLLVTSKEFSLKIKLLF